MKRLGHAIVLLALFCSPLLAERVVKVEALSTDTTTFRQNKIQLGMTELAAQLLPFQPVVDLSAYVLLAGDTDGQTIYGVADEGDPSSVGSLLLGVGAASQGLLRSGTTGGSVFVSPTLARLRGPDSNLFFSATASMVEMDGSNGFASIKGGTAVRYTYGQTPPTNANDPCTAGDTIDTATFHYFCAATDTWVRVAMATWP